MAPARTAALMSAARRETLASRAEQAPRSEFVKRELARLAAMMGSSKDLESAEPDVRGVEGANREALQKIADAKLESVRQKYAGKPIPIQTKAMADYIAGLSAELRERIEETF